MPEISVHGVRVAYRDEGQGVPIVLGHCSTGSGGQWRSLIGLLADRFRLIAPDHVGYGGTAPYAGDLPLMQVECDIVEAILDSLGHAAHLVGHSYGGSIMARTAIRAPEKVLSLTLIEPTLFHLLGLAGRQAEHVEIRAVADRVSAGVAAGDPEEAARGFIDYWGGRGAFAAMEPRVQSGIIATLSKLVTEWPTAFSPSGATIDALAALPMPVQLIGGARTTAPARAVVAILRELWPAAGYAEIAGAGHMAPLTHAAAVNAEIAQFLRVPGKSG